jgi:hypothetical protein
LFLVLVKSLFKMILKMNSAFELKAMNQLPII